MTEEVGRIACGVGWAKVGKQRLRAARHREDISSIGEHNFQPWSKNISRSKRNNSARKEYLRPTFAWLLSNPCTACAHPLSNPRRPSTVQPPSQLLVSTLFNFGPNPFSFQKEFHPRPTFDWRLSNPCTVSAHPASACRQTFVPPPPTRLNPLKSVQTKQPVKKIRPKNPSPNSPVPKTPFNNRSLCIQHPPTLTSVEHPSDLLTAFV
jgi:hypothetical protein